ncbi:tetratricopeptide repeat protein [Undibacterium arcticum]
MVGAAELAPTDYILKPFSVERLLLRIRRALERRALLLPVHQLLEHGEQHAAIQACRDGARQSPRQAGEFLRLRAELQLALGEATAAEATYRQLLQDRKLGWARHGLAKCLLLQGRHVEAQAMLQALVAEQPSLLDAYDSLAQTHEALGQLPAAQAVLQRAVEVSPHALGRLRRLGRVALDAGDLQIAEYALQQVVGKSSHSEFRDPEDQGAAGQDAAAAGPAGAGRPGDPPARRHARPRRQGRGLRRHRQRDAA